MKKELMYLIIGQWNFSESRRPHVAFVRRGKSDTYYHPTPASWKRIRDLQTYGKIKFGFMNADDHGLSTFWQVK